MKTGKFWLRALMLALLVTLLVTSVVGAASKGGIIVSLTVEQSSFEAGDDVLVSVTLFNATRQSVRVLKWLTPAEGMEEPLFAVTRDGQPVSYIGAIYKRPPVTGKDYVTLAAGESLTRTVNLGEYYDLSVTGQYEIAYNVSSFSLFSEKGNGFKLKDSLSSEKVSAAIVGRKGGGGTPPPPPPPGGNAFNACTIDQQNLLVSARNQAKTYSSEAENYLLAGTQGSRYTTWFGVFSSTRYNTVKSNFTSISDAMDNAGINFDCKCKQNYYAYVYPTQPYKIYLCRAFWTAPLSGTDSKAGTLIHEMSHFNVVASTDDVVYGQSGSMNLAISNPDAAITNADSHEYFAENTPFRP